MDGILDAIAKEGCSSLLEEVFLDLEVSLALPLQGLEHGVEQGVGRLHILLWTILLPASRSCYM